MQGHASWRDLLGDIITNPNERERIANEIGVRSTTLTRWVSGETKPRQSNLRHLIYALPKPQRDELLALLEDELPDLATSSELNAVPEIAYKFIMEVLDTRASIPDMLRFWSISHLVLQQALRQLDPERVGMAITVVRCMPPTSDGKVHSLRESIGLSTPPWGGDLEQAAIFLGAESLAGHVVASCRFEAIEDLSKNSAFLPAYQTEHEVSAAACPILLGGRVAGCLLLSSTQPNYFLSQARRSLIHGYAHLETLAFNQEEFYRPDLIELRIMPTLEIQRTYFANIQQMIIQRMLGSVTEGHPLTHFQAEQLVWQQLEDTLLHLPSR